MERFLSGHRKSVRYLFGGVAILTFAVYFASLGNGFVGWDDPIYIYDNPVITDFSLRSFVHVFTSYDPELYLPLTLLSLQLTDLIGGSDPLLFHLVSLLLHCANVVIAMWVVFLLAGKKLQRESALIVSIVTGLLFAFHPINTEAVAWASSRKDVLSGFFYLLTLLLYLRYRESGDRTVYHWSIAAMLLGALSKVVVISLPVVLLLIDWYTDRKIDGKVLREKVPFFLLSIIFGVVALFGKAGHGSLLLEKILIGSRSVMQYLEHIVFPSGLSALYPYTNEITFAQPELTGSLIAVTILCVLTILFAKRWKTLAFGWFFFLFALAPSLGNITSGQDLLLDVYIGSDRHVYIASIGIFFLVAMGIARFSTVSKYGALGATLVITAVLSLFTFQQSLVWRSTDTLFGNVLAHYPESHIAHMSLGGMRYTEGDIQGAMDHFQKSLAIRPSSAVYFDLGQIAVDNDQYAEAAAFFRKAIENRPLDTDAHINLGVVLIELEAYEDAADVLERGREIEPRNTKVLFNLATAYEKLGRVDEAREAYRKTADLDPGDSEAREKADSLK